MPSATKQRPARRRSEVLDDQSDGLTRPIPLSRIDPDPRQPRKRFDEAELEALGKTVKAQGVLQPVVVRAHPSKADRYMLVIGERRWRAARLAGLGTIPARVVSWTDRQCLEAQLAENDARAPIAGGEEADAVCRLVEEEGATAEEAAAVLGKSVSWVRNLLRVAKQLPAAARAALDSGQLALSVAEVIAGRPSEAMREQVAAYACTVQEQFEGGGRWVQLLPSVRAVKDWVATHCMVELKGAPFSTRDAGLVPSAGACASCPKRTGNARDQYPDGRADLCTDPACYRAKVAAWQLRTRAAAEAKGQKVLDAPAAAKVFPFEHSTSVTWQCEYLDVTDRCPEDVGAKKAPRTYGELVGPSVATVLAFDPAGGLHELVAKADALPILREKLGSATAGDYPAAAAEEAQKQRAAAAAEARLQRAVLSECLQSAAAAGQTAFGGLVGYRGAVPDLLRALVLDQARRCGGLDAVCTRRGWKGESREARVKALEAAAAYLTVPGLFGLLVELTAAPEFTSIGFNGHGWQKFLGIDRRKIEARLKAEQAGNRSNGSDRSHRTAKGKTLPKKG